MDPIEDARAVNRLAEHEHNTASEHGGCSVCYAWCLEALKLAMASRTHNVCQPRVFDKVARVWVEPKVGE